MKGNEESLIQQEAVFERCIEIFIDRNRVRGDLWAESPMDKHLDMAIEKINRIKRNFYGIEEPIDLAVAIDDALDCINFVAFAYRDMTGLKPNATIRSD